VAAVALIALAVLPSAAAAEGGPNGPRAKSPGHPQFGFVDDFDQHLFAMGAAQDIGANVARISIPWYYTGWDALDELYDVFYAYNIRPIFTLVVTYPPPPVPLPPTPPPPVFPDFPIPAPQPEDLPEGPPVPDVKNFKPAEYAEHAAYMAVRYPWAKIQLLNEPNLPLFRSFTVEQTVEVVTTAARAVHAVAPNTRLIGPAASPDQGRGFDYTRAVYSQLPPDLDYVQAAVNIYPGPGKKRAFRQIKKSWKAARASGRKVWVTEITPGIYSPRRRRCNQIKEAFSYLKLKGAKALLFYRLREPHVLQNVQGRLWVVNLDGTRTDLYRCLKKAAKRLRKPGLPGRPRLRLDVTALNRVGGGDEVQVGFKITARPDYGSLGQGRARPVPGALIALGSETARTNELGRTAITISLDEPTLLRARAKRPGYRPDSVAVRVQPAPSRPTNRPRSWRP
jgi:hypothetical protein